MTIEEYIVDNLTQLTDRVYLSVAPAGQQYPYIIYYPLIEQYITYIDYAQDDCVDGIYVVDIYGDTFGSVINLSASIKDAIDNDGISRLLSSIDLSYLDKSNSNTPIYRIQHRYRYNIHDTVY